MPVSCPSPAQRLGGGLGRDAVRRERDRIDGARDQVGAAAGGLERDRERVPRGALAVEADRQARQLVQLGDQLARARRLQQAGGIVQQHARGAELRHALRGLDERLAAVASVQQARVELAPDVDDRLGRVAQVLDVVQRVVQAEDVDAALGRGGHEAPHDVAAERPRADEEAAADRQRERRLRVRLQRADALPRALDAAMDGRVEGAAARDLEVREAGGVEHLRELEQRGGGHDARERLLSEHANRGVDQPWHDGRP